MAAWKTRQAHPTKTSAATIIAQDPDGRPVRQEGQIALRRVNDVPGATEQQLRWHIDGVTLGLMH